VRRGVRRIAGSHGTLSVNALAAENVGAVIDWDLTEMSKYAPPFISGSNSKDVKAEWKVRSEASSIRLQRKRGRDGLGGAVASRLVLPLQGPTWSSKSRLAWGHVVRRRDA